MCNFLFFKWAALVLFIFVIFQAQILQNTEPLTKKFCNFWSGCSSLQLLVVNWKKYPLEFHWQKWPKYVVTLWAIFKTSLFNYQMLWVTFEKSFENMGYFLFQHLVTPHRVLIIIELFLSLLPVQENILWRTCSANKLALFKSAFNPKHLPAQIWSPWCQYY